jgi:hypothetical protein
MNKVEKPYIHSGAPILIDILVKKAISHSMGTKIMLFLETYCIIL